MGRPKKSSTQADGGAINPLTFSHYALANGRTGYLIAPNLTGNCDMFRYFDDACVEAQRFANSYNEAVRLQAVDTDDRMRVARVVRARVN